MKYIRYVSACVAVAVTLSLLSSCRGKHGAENDGTTPPTTGDHTAVVGGVVLEPSLGDASVTAEPETAPVMLPADEPSVGDYTPSGETVITLGNTVTAVGDGATVEGSTVTVTKAGVYLISGRANDGQIIVDTTDEEKIILLFNGASLSCSAGPAILVRSAPQKVVISTVADSVNILSDGEDYVIPDEQQVEGDIYPNACIYSCEDLELTGEGELHVKGNADKGINTKDDLKIKGGTVTVTSVGVGIRANDSLEISGGTVTVSTGGDGIKTANTETDGKGYLTITGGSLYITAKGDGLSAATNLTVSGGNLVLTTTDTNGEILKESAGNSTTSSGGGFGRPGGMGGMMEGNSNKSSISAKGLKAKGTLTVSGGRITVVACDDGIHSNTDVYITSGTIHIRAADDGIHAEKELTIAGGALTIAQSYEGLEALHITVMGGTNRITASDDGANATSGEGGGFGGGMGGGPGGGFGGGFGGGRPGGGGNTSSGNNTSSSDSPLLKFTGGYTVINAGGDGIDSNGNIDITGGVVIVYGPTDNGNGPIDSGDGGYGVTISGGLLLAVGSNGMAETADNNGQAVLAASWRSGGLSAGSTMGIVDESGRVLAAFELPKAIQSIVFSCPDLVSGQTYSIVGGGTFTGTATDGVIDPATYTGYESMGEIKAN